MLKTMFWPGFVTILSLSMLAIWFHHNSVEFELRNNALEHLKTDYSWADVRLNGRDLSLYGISPSIEAHQKAMETLKQLDGVRIVIDQSSLLPIAKPFRTSISLSAGEIRISGSFASTSDRSYFIKLISQTVPAVSILDEAQIARGASDGYVLMLEQALKDVAQYSTWGIEIIGSQVKTTTPGEKS